MQEFDFFYAASLGLTLILIGGVIFYYQFYNSFQVYTSFRIILWNFLLSLCLISCVFTIGETYYRFFTDRTDSFSLNKISQRWMKRHYQLNNFAVRDNITYSFRIANGKRRVSFIGDSFTAGHGIKDVNNRFGNILRNKHPNTEVHLLASNGANSMHELKTLLDLFKKGYEFDNIILAYCLNDIDYLLDESADVYQRIRNFRNNLGFFGNESYFINTLNFQWFAFNNQDVINYSEFVMKAYKDEKWEKQKETLRKIKYFANKVGAQFKVVTFPFLQEKSNSYSFRHIHQKINKFWVEEGVEHLDLLDAFESYLGDKLVVNKYDAHPNEFANKLAAEAIDRFISRKSLTRNIEP